MKNVAVVGQLAVLNCFSFQWCTGTNCDTWARELAASSLSAIILLTNDSLRVTKRTAEVGHSGVPQ